MARKLGVFGPRAEVLEAMNGSGNGSEPEGAKHEGSLSEQMLTSGSTDWTPEQTEQYIDWRLQNLDAEIAALSPLRLRPVKRPLTITYGTAELPALVENSRDFNTKRAAAHMAGPVHRCGSGESHEIWLRR